MNIRNASIWMSLLDSCTTMAIENQISQNPSRNPPLSPTKEKRKKKKKPRKNVVSSSAWFAWESLELGGQLGICVIGDETSVIRRIIRSLRRKLQASNNDLTNLMDHSTVAVRLTNWKGCDFIGICSVVMHLWLRKLLYQVVSCAFAF